ncbi:MAG: DUF3800 domain-containing protein [Rhizobiaceae bacterium]|nr:DUF3800 domain-containing protein [Rhizobiaceae bacterium]
MQISIYCDESCHLQNDRIPVMGLGAVVAPKESVRDLSAQLKTFKRGSQAGGELKWSKVSPSKIEFYKQIVDWFFIDNRIRFRCLIVPNKAGLDHAKYNQGSHDDFIYKQYFSLLSKVLSPQDEHNIYIDIKDSRSAKKVATLRDILCNNRYDFTGEMIDRIQHVRSHEVELMQLADFLLGAVVYRNRHLETSAAKTQLAMQIEAHIARSLSRSAPLSEQKFNVFVWKPRVA